MPTAIFRTTKSNRRAFKAHAPKLDGKPRCGLDRKVLGWQGDFCAPVTCKTCLRLLKLPPA